MKKIKINAISIYSFIFDWPNEGLFVKRCICKCEMLFSSTYFTFYAVVVVVDANIDKKRIKKKEFKIIIDFKNKLVFFVVFVECMNQRICMYEYKHNENYNY